MRIVLGPGCDRVQDPFIIFVVGEEPLACNTRNASRIVHVARERPIWADAHPRSPASSTEGRQRFRGDFDLILARVILPSVISLESFKPYESLAL
jgi:hypothetical protein